MRKGPLTFTNFICGGNKYEPYRCTFDRAPITGRVVFQRHFHGLFGSLRDPRMILGNERATTVFEQDGRQAAVVQIASRVVRQIKVFVREGEQVAAGQRIGAIRFGSQVDVVIPRDVTLVVRPGERVRVDPTLYGKSPPPVLPLASAKTATICSSV